MIKKYFYNQIVKYPKYKWAFKIRKILINSFHILYYHNENTWLKNKFLGYNIEQCPLDLHLYQEIIYDKKPDYIIQTGVNFGGSVLYLCSILDLINAPNEVKVIGIDIILKDSAKQINHPRLILIEGSSTSIDTISKLNEITRNQLGMVILDSDHSYSHVIEELYIYKKYIKSGQFLVVEDTNLNGNPVSPGFGPGPLKAVDEFLKENDNFIKSDIWKRNLYSHHQNGWLLKTN